MNTDVRRSALYILRKVTTGILKTGRNFQCDWNLGIDVIYMPETILITMSLADPSDMV